MSYPWRPTLGFVNCRPKNYRDYGFDIFPKPAAICSEKCVYYIFCKKDNIIRNMTLGERIKTIKLILQRPYHFFSLKQDGSVMIVLEGEGVPRFAFQGLNILESVGAAEKYIKQEQKMGSLRKLDLKETEKEKTEPGKSEKIEEKDPNKTEEEVPEKTEG